MATLPGTACSFTLASRRSPCWPWAANLEVAIREGLKDLDEWYDVIGADSGEQCLEMLKNNQIPDIILLDIMMPGISGWETFERLRENKSWSHIPVIFLTARTDEMAKGAGIFLGDDFIEKPFEIRDLKNRIDKLLIKKSSPH